MSSLLLVEDDISLGQTLKERLEREKLQVIWARSEQESRSLFQSQDFDLVILDVGLPDGSGFELAQWIRERSTVPFIFVTAQGSAEDRLKGYELGAEEYIPKPFHLKELLMRVAHVLENHRSSSLLKIEDVEIDFEAMTVQREGQKKVSLASKDFLILKFLINNAPKVLSRDEILNAVWGDESFPTNRTIDNAILRLRQLLGDRAGLWIRSVRSVGYQWMEPEKEIS